MYACLCCCMQSLLTWSVPVTSAVTTPVSTHAPTMKMGWFPTRPRWCSSTRYDQRVTGYQPTAQRPTDRQTDNAMKQSDAARLSYGRNPMSSSLCETEWWLHSLIDYSRGLMSIIVIVIIIIIIIIICIVIIVNLLIVVLIWSIDWLSAILMAALFALWRPYMKRRACIECDYVMRSRIFTGVI